ncbi:MAG: hypothetical protein ABSG65_01265 [Bryobacteraceae bacterium]|jgi:hypothetical protein
MNDSELDELLDAWTAPPVPASLRKNVQAGFAASQTSWTVARVPRARKRMIAAAILVLAAFALVVAQAFPQKAAPPLRIPYTVDSEFLSYANDGSAVVEMYSTSYERDGAEILKSRSIPRHPLGTVIGRALDAALPLWSRLTARFTVAPEVLERVRRSAHQAVGAITGCDASCLVLEHYGFARAAVGLNTACIDGTIVGHQTILNHPTTAIQPRMGGSVRMTWWMAPDLGCFALRITTEKKRPDGTFRLVQEKRALRVNLTP